MERRLSRDKYIHTSNNLYETTLLVLSSMHAWWKNLLGTTLAVRMRHPVCGAAGRHSELVEAHSLCSSGMGWQSHTHEAAVMALWPTHFRVAGQGRLVS